jgi:hypothetical protein
LTRESLAERFGGRGNSFLTLSLTLAIEVTRDSKLRTEYGVRVLVVLSELDRSRSREMLTLFAGFVSA